MLFFMINEMIIAGSSYWNIAFGRQKGDALKDKEGISTIKNFAHNTAWLLKKIHTKSALKETAQKTVKTTTNAHAKR
jgi:multimeric flavodoxin WrbA